MAKLSPARWQVVSPYLDHALELGPEQRALWLASLHGKDPALAADIETLLRERSALSREGFLEGLAPHPASPASLASAACPSKRPSLRRASQTLPMPP